MQDKFGDFPSPIGGVLPTRSISGLGKKQKPWINREQVKKCQFLIENRSNTNDMEELNSRSLGKRIKYRSKLLKNLRQRFRKEYLGQLVQKRNEKRSRNLRIGESFSR
ncbi:integrase catalytic domain-containing protein [Nephila pilipes]|uniref:Integrase catalytic domain-containing protein n=1 Tax=Nephila pilipes TaxID=299642 RepID=A0A8X6PVT0_NEPPI|nr:integrase catalytic domain-containing protein [Nephila pilipes]